jgi:hypothetical protein
MLAGLLGREPYFRPVKRRDGRDFHLVPPFILNNAGDYCCETIEAKLSLIQAGSWEAMVALVHERLVKKGLIGRSDIMIEHSPSCAASVASAIRAVPNLKIVHIVRDPRDAVASMVARRRVAPQFSALSPRESLSLTARQWCFLNMAALAAEGSPGYRRIRYEDLVVRPKRTTAGLLRHLGAEPEKRRPSGPLILGELDRKEGWAASPTEAISRLSVGRYRRDLDAATLKQLMRLSFRFRGIGTTSISEMMQRFGYA